MYIVQKGINILINNILKLVCFHLSYFKISTNALTARITMTTETASTPTEVGTLLVTPDSCLPQNVICFTNRVLVSSDWL